MKLKGNYCVHTLNNNETNFRLWYYLIAKKAKITADRIHVDFNDTVLLGFGDDRWYFPQPAACSIAWHQ